MIEPYSAALIQAETRVVTPRDVGDRDDIVSANLERVLELLEWTFLRIGGVRLAVTPEYGLMGQYRPRELDEWLQVALPIPNRFTDRAGEKARELGCFIQLHFFERNDDWPGRYFNTTVVVAPSGAIVLTYRKHNGPNNLNTSYTGPADVLDRYVELYGEDALFPTVDTEIGRLGAMVCGDLVYPEMARAYGLAGVDVLLQPTAEPYALENEAWDAMRRARAAENVCYLLSANSGGFLGSNRPRSGYTGRSQAYGPRGELLGMIPGPGEAVITVPVDVENVRRLRTGGSGGGHAFNALLQMRSDLYRDVYARADRFPNNAFADVPITGVEQTRVIAAEIRQRLIAEGNLSTPVTAREA